MEWNLLVIGPICPAKRRARPGLPAVCTSFGPPRHRLTTARYLATLGAELKLNVNFFGGESASELNVSGRTDLKHQEFYIEGTYEMLA